MFIYLPETYLNSKVNIYLNIDFIDVNNAIIDITTAVCQTYLI